MTDYFAPDSCAFCGEIGKHAATCRKATPPPAPTAAEPKTYEEIHEWCLSQPIDLTANQAHAIACYFATPVPEQAQPAGVTEDARKYRELLYAVGNKYLGASRHETALRYIRRAEEPTGEKAACARAQEGEKP